MNEKDYSNIFRFSVSQGDVLLCEKMFDADKFNPFTRYSIDIRDILPRAITRLQKTLSKRSYDVFYDAGRVNTSDEDSDNCGYDLLAHHNRIINLYPKEIRNSLRYNPQSVVQQIEHKTIRGVPCKMGLYINDNPKIDYIKENFNPDECIILAFFEAEQNIKFLK